MADSSSWRPEGEGPHPTLGGNIFDPNVQADGKMYAGQGVGGTDEKRIRQEGLEHIQKNSDAGPTSSVGLGSSSAAPTDSQGGVAGTVKSYLGYGSTSAAPGETRTSDTMASTAEGTQSGTMATGDVTGPATAGREESVAGAQGDISNAEAAGTGAGPSASEDPGANPDSAAARAGEQQEVKEKSEGGESSGKGQLENKSAIPTAGGEKLGERHWGESKIIPDNPKPESNVSSADGQPTEQVKNNTAANTGGATGGPESMNKGGSEQKESLMDKIKDKLPIG